MGVLVTHFKASLVLQAIAITLCVVIGITLFTLQNKLDLSMLPAALVFHNILNLALPIIF